MKYRYYILVNGKWKRVPGIMVHGDLWYWSISKKRPTKWKRIWEPI
jgi:hypothetical protein